MANADIQLCFSLMLFIEVPAVFSYVNTVTAQFVEDHGCVFINANTISSFWQMSSVDCSLFLVGISVFYVKQN